MACGISNVFTSLRDVGQRLNLPYNVGTLLLCREWMMVLDVPGDLLRHDGILVSPANNDTELGSMHEQILPMGHLVIQYPPGSVNQLYILGLMDVSCISRCPRVVLANPSPP